MGDDRREATKAKRAKAFKSEQREYVSRLQTMITAVLAGSMYEINHAYFLVGASLKYLEANDPGREK